MVAAWWLQWLRGDGVDAAQSRRVGCDFFACSFKHLQILENSCGQNHSPCRYLNQQGDGTNGNDADDSQQQGPEED